jgi:phospholipid-translocating ATPase
MQTKTVTTLLVLFPVVLWFAWNVFFAETAIASGKSPSPYAVYKGFTQHFGTQLIWWTTILLTLAALTVFDLGVQAVRRVYFPTETDLWQERERDGRKAASGADSVERG